MVAGRSLLESISIGKLLDDFFVTAHREAVHDLVPHGFFDERSALEHLVAAQRNLLVVLLVADSWPVDRHALAINDTESRLSRHR